MLNPLMEPGAGVRVASLPELFRLKSLVTARRSRIRDWLDLYVLMTRYGFDMAQFHEAFAMAGIPDQAATGVWRLCYGTPHVADEGVEQIAPGLPTVEVVQAYFREQRDRFERSAAAVAWRERHDG